MNKDKLEAVLENITEQISSAPEEQRGLIFAEVLTDIWGEDVGKALGVLELSRKSVFSYAKASNEYVEKQYLTRELHEWLYECILDTGLSMKEAFALSVEVFEVTLEYLNDARNNVHAKGRMQEIVSIFDNNSVQRGMIKRGIVTKRELQGHKTPTGQLSRLHQGVKLYNTLTSLEDRVTDSEEVIRATKTSMSIVEEEVEILNKLNSTGISKERKIAICKENGLTQKETADKLGVSISTVKRGWKGWGS